MQITGIGFTFLGNNEEATIVNRLDPSKKYTVSAKEDDIASDFELTQGGGWANLSGFDLKINGGENINEMFSVYNSGGTGAFCLTGIQVSVIDKSSDNTVLLTALGSGSEGDEKYTDVSPLVVDAGGVISNGGEIAYHDWSIQGATNIASFFGTQFTMTTSGMLETNTTEGADYGSMITPGGIDRANNGCMGVRNPGQNAGGLQNKEGFLFGFDLSNISEEASLQVMGVDVQYLGNDEIGTVVNRLNPEQKKTFSAIEAEGSEDTTTDVELISGSGMVNIDDFNIVLEGGQNNSEIISVFNSGGKGDFRVRGLKFKLLTKDAATSVETTKEAQEIKVYPTVVDDVVNVEVEELQEENAVMIYSVAGNLLDSQSLKGELTQLETKTLPAGVYLCVVRNGSDIRTMQIVKH